MECERSSNLRCHALVCWQNTLVPVSVGIPRVLSLVASLVASMAVSVGTHGSTICINVYVN